MNRLIAIFAAQKDSYMFGIYVHVPFCRSRCIYCGFYSTTSLAHRDRYVRALCDELTEYSGKLDGNVATIYFGGGTPSQLSLDHLSSVMTNIRDNYTIDASAEVTIECNPDDINEDYLSGLRSLGYNRLSMGVQSFDDSRLTFLRRRHSSTQAVKAVELAKQAGFDNISIDLMFGFPGQTLDQWKDDIHTALSLGVQHLSAYSLMYEDGTRLTEMLDKGAVSEIDEELSVLMYECLIDEAESAGFEHYELSNWALPGHRSRHNSSYWHNIPYLGAGAAAHSFDGKKRWSNPTSLTEYLEGMEDKRLQREYEQLSTNEIYDEYVMTGLRTKDGIDLNDLTERFGYLMTDYLMNNAETHIKGGRLELINGSNGHNIIRLTRRGLFVSNDVMSDLMYI